MRRRPLSLADTNGLLEATSRKAPSECKVFNIGASSPALPGRSFRGKGQTSHGAWGSGCMGESAPMLVRTEAVYELLH